MKLTLFVDLINCRGQFINANDVIAFFLHLMNKVRRNLIKIRSYAIFKWFLTGLAGFLVTIRSVNIIGYFMVSEE